MRPDVNFMLLKETFLLKSSFSLLRGALILRGPIDLKVLMLFDVHRMFCEPFRVKGALILRFSDFSGLL